MHAAYVLAAAGFEAARRVEQASGPQANLHGHSFHVLARADVTHTDGDSLKAALAEAVAPFNYADLNSRLADTDDLAIAHSLAATLSSPVAVALRSAPDRGVTVENGSAYVWIHVHFEAAHQLPQVPVGHKCGRLHGHSFAVRLVADAAHASHADLQAAWAPLYARLNHRYLNEMEGLANPTSEVIAHWLYNELSANLNGLKWVEVRETHTAGSQYDGERFRIWKEQTFESAVPFDDAGHYTGHSYLMRLMLTGKLDHTMGWVLDFGDVKDRFKPVYRQLDHNPLDRLTGIRNGDSQSVAEWVHAHLSPLLPELTRIDLMEHDNRGVSLMFHDDMRWPLL